MVRFDSRSRLIFVRAVVQGPLGEVNLRLALDTGSTRTVIDPFRLESVGIGLSVASTHVHVTTASNLERAPLVPVSKLSALGTSRVDLEIVAHRLPKQATFDGLLGLDFVRDRRLTIDFRAGSIRLS
jgi:predicted aspartyl protease